MTDTHYHFVPSLRQGLATVITKPADAARAELTAHLHVSRRLKATGDWDLNLPAIVQPLKLRGPGDIVDFDDSMVVRTDPKPDSGNFEPNYFPLVEFADVDFPWRYTADAASPIGLTPWIVLVVLIAEDRGEVSREFDDLPRSGHQRKLIKVHDKKSLPDLSLSRRWAHVHATTNAANLSHEAFEDLAKTDPKCVVSRLMNTRRLRPGTLYTAFLVPSFKRGWAAGIDSLEAHEEAGNCDALEPAWNHLESGPLELPVYYQWSFRTSQRGDFEYLVRLLEPRRLTGLGLRKLDCRRPGFGLSLVRSAVADPDVVHMLEMEGALQSLDTQFSNWGADSGDSTQTEPFRTDLVDLLARADSEQSIAELPAGYASGIFKSLSFMALDDGTSVRVHWTTEEESTVLFEWGPQHEVGSNRLGRPIHAIHPRYPGRPAPVPGFQYMYKVACDGPATEHECVVTLVPETTYHMRFNVTNHASGVMAATPDAILKLRLPAVVPPIYGRWHAGRRAVFADPKRKGWVDVLNLDPRHRAASGLGAEVVRRHQDALMASAWEQVGAIESANEILRRAQLGRTVSNVLHGRLGSMSLEDYLRVTAPAQRRVVRPDGDGAPRAIPAELAAETWIPRATLTSTFRRLVRARGPIRRRQGVDSLRALERLADDFRPAGELGPPAGTPTPCEISGMTYQQYVKESDGTASSTSLRVDAMRFCYGQFDCKMVGGWLPESGISNEKLKIETVCEVFNDLLTPTEQPTIRESKNRAFLFDLRVHIHSMLNPETTITERTKRRLRLKGVLADRFNNAAYDPLDILMAYPEYPQPMYEPLKKLSQDLVLPGIEKVPQNTIGILKTNRRFVESYMVGLNHEFAGELLWRRYPTDQRGSYFRQFWDVSEYVGAESSVGAENEVENGALTEDVIKRLKDIRPINKWPDDSRLGSNPSEEHPASSSSRAPEQEEPLVLVIRGDLFQRYPNAVVYAVDAQPGASLPDMPEFGGQSVGSGQYPLFRGSLGADLVFLGFSFSESQARSVSGVGGKFFVIEERVSEARFGLDVADVSVPTKFNPITVEGWSNLNWGHFQLAEISKSGQYLDASPMTIRLDASLNPSRNQFLEVWDQASSSALLARISSQRPARLVLHADQMLPEKERT